MRAVVVDTNVLVSALLSSGGPPAQVMAAILGGRLRTVLCATMLAEYHQVLRRPRFRLNPARVDALLDLVEATAEHVPVLPYDGTPPLRDPTDWPFIACALATGCPVITGNVKHFPQGLGLQVMSARAWVEASSAC